MSEAVVSWATIVIFSLLWLWRVEWVYRARMKVLRKQNYGEYCKLPDYEAMVFKFWIWDVEKFKKS